MLPLLMQVQKLLGSQPLRLSLKGLDYMSDDPTDMHVLYLKVWHIQRAAGCTTSKLRRAMWGRHCVQCGAGIAVDC